MPISKYLSDKWDQRLYNWYLWIVSGGGKTTSSGVSSIYDVSRWRRGSRRMSGVVVLSGEAEEVDSLLLRIRNDKTQGGERVFAALVEWVKDDGTRGQQANRLSMSGDTYRDLVDSGKRWLERLSQQSRRPYLAGDPRGK